MTQQPHPTHQPWRSHILELADVVASLPPEHFSMRDWLWQGENHSVSAGPGTMRELMDPAQCGTAACLGGTAAALLTERTGISAAQSDVESWLGIRGLDLQGAPMPGRAAEGLEVGDMSDELFCPLGFSTHPEQYPQAAAVRVLQILSAEGVVDWPRAIAEVAS